MLEYSGTNFYIRPNFIVAIPSYERDCNRLKSEKQIQNEVNLLNNDNAGLISKKADKKIRNAVNWLYVSATNKRGYDKIKKESYQWKLNFITLTLPTTNHTISDNQFKNELLKKFLFNAKYSFGLQNYIWKVEAQENDNIHCHLTTDKFLDYEKLLNCWNKILSKYGLIDEYKKKHSKMSLEDYLLEYGYNYEIKNFKGEVIRFISKQDVIDRYNKGVANKWEKPNTVDVGAVRQVKDLTAYICDYLAKNEDGRRKIKGRLWGSNYNLSDAQKCSVTHRIDNESEVGNWINSDTTEKRPIETKPNVFGEKMQIGELIFMNDNSWSKAPSILKDRYNDQRLIIRKSIGIYNFKKKSQVKKIYNMTYQV